MDRGDTTKVTCQAAPYPFECSTLPPSMLSSAGPDNAVRPDFSKCAGLALLGPIDEKFVEVTDVYAPLADGREDNAFISRGGPLFLHTPLSSFNVHGTVPGMLPSPPLYLGLLWD